jgi:hypothetical protein
MASVHPFYKQLGGKQFYWKISGGEKTLSFTIGRNKSCWSSSMQTSKYTDHALAIQFIFRSGLKANELFF